MEVKSIVNLRDLKDIKKPWKQLLSEVSNKNPHLSFEWLYLCAKHLRNSGKLFILTAHQDNQLVGIAPLVIRRRYLRKTVPWREVLYLGFGPSDFHDFIIPDNERESVITSFLEYLNQQAWGWDELIFSHIPQTSPNLKTFKEAVNRLGLQFTEEKHTKCYYVDFTKYETFESYISTTSKKFVQRDVSRLMNKSERLGGCEFVRNTSLDGSELFEIIDPLHKKRQRFLGRESMFEKPAKKAFLQEMLEIFNNLDILDFSLLRLKELSEKVIAYTLGFRYNQVVYWWNTAFHPAFRKLSPSKLLLYLYLKDCYQQGVKEFSFMRGEASYKKKWTKDYRWNYKMRITNTKSPYSKLIHRIRKNYREKVHDE